MKKKICIQGFEGSFHQVAAEHFFGKNIEVICCSTFREVVKLSAAKLNCDGGVMAIENSIAGSILPNYNLLQKSNVKIVGEVYLQVKQNLLANPGVKLEDIREVHSHPMALLQCIDYLENHNWKLIETEDTALSAKHIHQHKSKHIAAVAGRLAANLFNLNIIAANIHTLKNNYTRFLILQNAEDANEINDANKASVIFNTDHTKGSLARVLTKIADAGINLSKLQSMPIQDSDWKYSFHADLEFETPAHFYSVMKSVTSLTEALKIYGIYKNGKG
ncbi:MAG: prephenate dehydratase [Chitinophagaceae bacterium]|nr:prephenate dehydratase [Chitinophagaceae bacterium]